MRYAWLLFIFTVLFSCESPSIPQKKVFQTIEGKTMGTYYRVTCDCKNPDLLKTSLDSLLFAINAEVSTYIPEALISRFNQSESGLRVPDTAAHFRENFSLAADLFRQTKGYFDPTVMPLVNYWGFGYTEKKPVTAVDSNQIAVLMTAVGFDRVISYEEGLANISKSVPGVQLDFSACAKGYAVDLVGKHLQSRGIDHYFVDIGGEVRARGDSPRGDAWNVGIQTPREDADMGEIQLVVPLNNLSVATSGNYRNFYEVGGQKYSHTINPFTGFPERSTLLSASVFHESCAVADAFATAFMVMGAEKAFAFASEREDLEAYFIIAGGDGALEEKHTSGLAAYFAEQTNE
jgi:thiamine biosynthesis lipoprotein